MSDNALPTISIVTPSFNQGLYLESTIQSILGQEYPQLEYIIMDGGSTDGSVSIIQNYASKLSHWESRPDKGQADAIFRGFQMAKGDILCWVNSDDMLLPSCLSKVGNWFRMNSNEEWMVGGSILIGADGKPVLNRFRRPRCDLGARVTFDQLLHLGCPFAQPASFWRREVFFEVGGFDQNLQFCFDYDLYFRLASRRPSGNLRDFLALFRVHPGSKSSRIRHVQLVENEQLWTKYGRYHRSTMTQTILRLWYLNRARLRNGGLQLCQLLNILKASNIK